MNNLTRMLLFFALLVCLQYFYGCVVRQRIVIEDGTVYQIERPLEDRRLKVGWKGWV